MINISSRVQITEEEYKDYLEGIEEIEKIVYAVKESYERIERMRGLRKRDISRFRPWMPKKKKHVRWDI